MEWITVISLILIGIILIVVEILFVPGTTIVGIFGFCMAIGGTALSFYYFGRPIGWITLGSTGVLTMGLIVWSLRGRPWERFALKTSINSKVNEGAFASLQVGAEGVAVSSLRPGGKADFSEKLYEVTTLGNFADSGTRVKIISVSSHQIVVEPLN